MRRIVALIDADEYMLLEHHPEDGVGAAFATEMGWVNDSGIHVVAWAISDADDTDAYARYLHYLFHWTMDHAENLDKLDSPMSYAQWRESELMA